MQTCTYQLPRQIIEYHYELISSSERFHPYIKHDHAHWHAKLNVNQPRHSSQPS